jgi:AcrR family transcriptional regulator
MAAKNYAKNLKQDSKNWITIATLELLQTKKLSEMTVAEVAKRSGVSRMAFYRHFTNLPQVLTEYYEPKFQKIFDQTIHKISEEQKITDLGDFFTELTPDFQRAIAGDYTMIIFQIFTEQMARFYDTTTTWSDWENPKRLYWIKFMSAGIFEVWLTWIQTGQKESLAEMTQLIKAFHE